MQLSNRRQEIMNLLRLQGSVTVEELKETFDVSEETVRRDLNALEEEGMLNRVYGGAYLGNLVNQTLSNDMRKETMRAEKERVANICVGMIENGDTIMLDSSTTAYYLAKRLMNYSNLTVITNSLDIAYLLSSYKGVHVICCGGHLSKKYMSFMEMDAWEDVCKYYVDTCFVSCTGIGVKCGLSDSIEMQGRIRREMLRHAQKKICIADDTKIGKTTLYQICAINELDGIVLNQKPSKEWLDEFEKNEVLCYYPED